MTQDLSTLTRDDIIRMARESGLPVQIFQLERFAELVAAAEREACAKACENMPWVNGKTLPSNVEMAAAIRARNTIF